MKFIIPKNFKTKTKLLGLIDYQTALLNLIWGLILYFIINLFSLPLTTKLYSFIVLFIPFLLFSIIGINNENLISVLFYIIKFYTKPKLYLYKKRV